MVVELDRRAVDLLTRALNTEYRRLQLELKIIEELEKVAERISRGIPSKS